MKKLACARSSAVFLAGLVLAAGATVFASSSAAAPAVVAPSGLTPVPVSGVEVPPPPPLPRDPDGKQVMGSWTGPYTFRNFNSGKCLDVLGASQASGAPAVQYTCVAGGVSQMWWTFFAEGDGSIAFELLGNAHSQMCLAPGHPYGLNGPVIQLPECYRHPLFYWIAKSETNTRQNDYLDLCMETQGGSLDNFARIVLWECHGQAHQHWFKYAV